MKIYFCETCGTSVPLQEVVGGRAKSTDGHVYCSHHMPGVPDGDLKLYFCESCGVSIPLQDVITGVAPTQGDGTVCVSCAHKAEKREGSGDRFRLYFCDSCNTSVPQSHVVTGRATVRGGKTYCEACRDRATRQMSPVVPVVAVVILAAAALGLVLMFGPGARDDEPVGPDPMKVRLDEMEQALGTRIEGLNSDDDNLRTRLEDVLGQLRTAREQSTRELAQVEAKIKILESAVAEREALRLKLRDLETKVADLAGLEQKVARLDRVEAELAKAKRDLEAARREAAAAPEPRPVDPPKPEPMPEAADVPAPVASQLALLANPDSGKRFSAAVELGKLGHSAAVPALAKVLLDDEDYFVRRAAARALGKINSRDSVPALIDALTDDEIFVSLQAAKSLRSITGKAFGFDENLSESQRRRVQAKWKKWWKDENK